MSDVSEVFNILQNEGTLAGEAATSRRDALDLVAGIRGLLGFSFQTHDGFAVLPTLTTDGKLPVTSDSAGVKVGGHATVTGVIGVETLITSATLLTDKLYKLDFLSGACTQTVLWTIKQNDNGVETPVHKFITGSGQYTEQLRPGCLEFDTGSTGPQEVKLYATQVKGSPSDCHGTVCLLQIGA